MREMVIVHINEEARKVPRLCCGWNIFIEAPWAQTSTHRIVRHNGQEEPVQEFGPDDEFEVRKNDSFYVVPRGSFGIGAW